jgi:hypothetical protein
VPTTSLMQSTLINGNLSDTSSVFMPTTLPSDSTVSDPNVLSNYKMQVYNSNSAR